jgi:hypothetical protein
MDHYHDHKDQALVPVLSHMNLAHILKRYFFKISFNTSRKVIMRVNLAILFTFCNRLACLHTASKASVYSRAF